MHPDTCKNARKILVPKVGGGSQVLILPLCFSMSKNITNICVCIDAYTYNYIINILKKFNHKLACDQQVVSIGGPYGLCPQTWALPHAEGQEWMEDGGLDPGQHHVQASHLSAASTGMATPEGSRESPGLEVWAPGFPALPLITG